MNLENHLIIQLKYGQQITKMTLWESAGDLLEMKRRKKIFKPGNPLA